jgi:type IV secretory pathway ATPase VirB11/archaellum biosynthesis ATPase
MKGVKVTDAERAYILGETDAPPPPRTRLLIQFSNGYQRDASLVDLLDAVKRLALRMKIRKEMRVEVANEFADAVLARHAAQRPLERTAV